jgi:hypothetical protein
LQEESKDVNVEAHDSQQKPVPYHLAEAEYPNYLNLMDDSFSLSDNDSDLKINPP